MASHAFLVGEREAEVPSLALDDESDGPWQ